ncbi:MAG: hypothetical protein M3Y72_11625 [Acidobacteriota bacterium]|nr:hypothetical protein [Acidobacteriota bacterium]
MGTYPAIPERLLKIDEFIALQHYHVNVEDDCYHLWERETGARWDQNPVNQLIKNLQITNSETDENPNRLYYKKQAALHSIKALNQTIPAEWRRFTFVPVPPSIIASNPGYDPRLPEILKWITGLSDVREIVRLTQSGTSKQKSISPETRASTYELDEALCTPEPQRIFIFDDVLTGGSHFAGMKIALRRKFSCVPISGIFLARSIHSEPLSLGSLFTSTQD